jgi:hypothetical protein
MSDAPEEVITVKKVKKAFVNEEPEEDPDVSEVDAEEEDDEDNDEDFEFDMDEMNLGSILQNFLVNEEGVNVCDVLTGLKKSLDTQNKILMKVVNLFENKKK